MYYILKCFTYTIVLFSFLSIMSFVDIIIHDIDYQYSIQISIEDEPLLTEYDKNSDIEIYRNYESSFNRTPYYYNLGGESFVYSKPHTSFNYPSGGYLIVASENEIIHFENFLLQNNISYTLEPADTNFQYHIPLVLIITFLCSIFSFILLIIHRANSTKKRIKIRKISGQSDFIIWKALNYSHLIIGVSIIISIGVFILSYGYINLFLISFFILMLATLVFIDYVLFSFVSRNNIKIKFIFFALNLLLASFVFIGLIGSLQTITLQYGDIQELQWTKDNMSDYYISTTCTVNSVENTETACSDMYFYAEELGMAYSYDVTEDFNGNTILELNKNMLNFLGLGEYENYNFIIPSNLESTSLELINYTTYETNVEDAPIIQVNEGVYQTPFIISPNFDYELYQATSTSYQHVISFNSYYNKQIIEFIFSITRSITLLVVVIMMLVMNIYLFVINYITLNRQKFQLKLLQGFSNHNILRGFYQNLTILFLITLIMDVLLIGNIRLIIYLTIFWIIVFLLAKYIGNKELLKLVGGNND